MSTLIPSTINAKNALVTHMTPESLFDNLSNIIGRPYGFLQSTDPSMRTFVKHMVPAAPLIMIRPGRIKFSDEPTKFLNDTLTSLGFSAASQTTDASGRALPDPSFSDEYGITAADKAAINKAISDKKYGTVQNFNIEGNSGSVRYFEFDSSLSVKREYQSVLSTLSGRLYSRFNNSAMTWLDARGDWDSKSTTNGGFYTFWADNASSVSESASAEVGATKLAGLVKGVADASREMQFVLSSSWGTKATNGETKKAGMVDSAVQGIADYIGGSSTDVGLRASLGDAILGMNPMFPEVWKDSTFNRSYNVSFKFYSPYGDPAAVYQNVLLPFVMLLSMVMPVQSGTGTYTEPFVFQMDCPGYFACDLGICTDFSFTKGGSENLWTVDGLPRQIDVTMAVKDLYPVLMASKNNKSLYFNIGMGTFLDNLAGISLFRGNGGKSDLITRTRASITSKLSQARAIPGQVVSSAQVFLENQTPIPAMFRAASEIKNRS